MPVSEKSLKENKKEADLEALPPSLQETIKNIIEKEHFTEYEVIVENLSTNGENYLGTVYQVDVKGRTSERQKELNVFVKEKIFLKSKEFLNCDRIYEYEAFMYKEISKTMNYLQDEANVPPEDRFKLANAYDETDKDAIILENLSKKGYERIHSQEALSIKFYQLAVEELAKFHALSLVIQERMPKYFKEKIEVLNTPFTFNEDFNALMTKVCTHLASLYENETKDRIEELLSFIVNNFQNYHSNKTSVRTLSHGDFRKSNCMIRMKNGELDEVIIIDYQLMDCGCPVRDLLLMIICESDREFRKKHLNDLKNLYFEKMTNFLKYFDIDVETVFPRKEFDRLCSEYMKHVLIMFLYFSVHILAEDRYDLQKLMLSDLPYHPNRAGERIVCDFIDECVEWGHL